MTIWRSASRVFAVLALVTLVGGLAINTRAQESFGGVTIDAVADSSRWTYNQPSAGVPAEPTGEMNYVHSEAKLSTGPSGYGLSSAVWPGQTPANAPGFAYSQFPPEFRDNVPINDPNYPVRAETFYPQGPEQARNEPAGGVRMRSAARESVVDAQTAVDRSGLPGFVEFGTQTSSVVSTVEGGLASAEGRATASDIKLFGGFIIVESVTTTAGATSDGVEGKVGGETVVSGVTISGERVQVDESGIHYGDQGGGEQLAPARQAVQQALAQAGIDITVAGPIDEVDGASASRSLGGLVVRFTPEAFRQGVEQLPAPIRDEIKSNIPMDQTITLTIAGVQVEAAATEGALFEFPADDGGTDSFTGGTFTGGGDTGGFSSDVLSGSAGIADTTGSTDVGSPVGGPAEAEPVAARPVLDLLPTDGIPFWLIVGALGLAALASRWLARAADGALAAGAVAGGPCPLERNEEDE